MYDNVEQALQAVEARRRQKKDLQAFQAFVKQVCPKAFELPIIHVAGTNGKGSTVNYIRSMLNALGYRVGTLTSPALRIHFDRIRIDDEWMDSDTFLSLVNRYDDLWQKMGLAMFDIDVHLAMEWFVREQVDMVILETGLGGRLDATNIFEPIVSVITNIGHDHMKLLGNTLTEIAAEKAGIIKKNVPLITTEQNPDCLRVFRQTCEQKEALMSVVPRPSVRRDAKGFVEYLDESGEWIHLNTFAAYQAVNAALAEQCVIKICPNAKREKIKEALPRAQWAGRFQILHEEPTVIVDGAHNREGVHALCQSLKEMTVDTVIFSVLEDKEGEEMLSELQQVCRRVILCSFAQERLADLKQLAEQHQLPLAHDLKTLVDERMAQDECIVICGSLYFVSEAVRLFDHK